MAASSSGGGKGAPSEVLVPPCSLYSLLVAWSCLLLLGVAPHVFLTQHSQGGASRSEHSQSFRASSSSRQQTGSEEWQGLTLFGAPLSVDLTLDALAGTFSIYSVNQDVTPVHHQASRFGLLDESKNRLILSLQFPAIVVQAQVCLFLLLLTSTPTPTPHAQ